MSQINDISQKVIEKIIAGKVKMKPKAFFVFQAAVLVFIAVISMILAIFFTSFVGFALKVKGFSPFLTALILTVVLFIILAWLLARKFPVFYKKPLVFGLAVILISVAMVSLAVFLTPFHQKILEYSQQINIPFITPLYECGCGRSSCSRVCNQGKNSLENSQQTCGCASGSEPKGACNIK